MPVQMSGQCVSVDKPLSARCGLNVFFVARYAGLSVVLLLAAMTTLTLLVMPPGVLSVSLGDKAVNEDIETVNEEDTADRANDVDQPPTSPTMLGSNEEPKDEQMLSTPIIIVIVICVVCLIIILLVIGCRLHHKRKLKKQQKLRQDDADTISQLEQKDLFNGDSKLVSGPRDRPTRNAEHRKWYDSKAIPFMDDKEESMDNLMQAYVSNK